VPRGQRDGSLRQYSRLSRQEPLLFYQVAPQLYSRDWVDPVPDPLLFFSGSAGNRLDILIHVIHDSIYYIIYYNFINSCVLFFTYLLNNILSNLFMTCFT
jgi:hypothetical protein